MSNRLDEVIVILLWGMMTVGLFTDNLALLVYDGILLLVFVLLNKKGGRHE